MPVTDAEFEYRTASDDALIERLYGQVFDLKASLGSLVAIMQNDIDGGKIRCTTTRLFLMNDAKNLSRHEIK